MNMKFDSEPVYGNKYKKTNELRVNTNFQGKEVPKENASYKFVIDNVRFCH